MIYLDHAATTAVRPEAAQAALRAMTENYGNPSSAYALGKAAAAQRDSDRAQIASALGCRPEEVYFTSCGTEGDNWAIRGAVWLNRRRGKHIITTAIEHAAVLEPLKQLEQEGYEITRLMPDRDGNISLEELKNALRPDTVLVSMMLVNNEVGSVLPVAEAAKIIKRSGAPALLHCDAVQGFLKVPFTVKSLGADLISVSGHKIGAPKGIGALYVRKGLNWKPLMFGGGQERGMRPGTEPTAQIAAFAEAVRLGKEEQAANLARLEELKDYARRRLAEEVPSLEFLGSGEAPHILCITLPGYKSEVLVRVLGDAGICVSAGSACHRGKPSHVFAALPITKAERDGAVRISFGPENTEEEIDIFTGVLKKAAAELFRSMS